MEVTLPATVLTPPRFFYGTKTHCMHEAFDVATPQGRCEVVDNVALAPRIAVRPGDRIEVRGELVRDPGREPVIHWTHHDPAHRHPDGFIRFRGRVYG